MPSQPSENKRLTRNRGMSLCLRCRKLDIESLRQTKHPTVMGHLIPKESLATKPYLLTCPLCTLFDQMYGASTHGRDRRYQLRSLSSTRIKERGWASVDTIMLSMDGAGTKSYLVPQIKGSGPVRILGPRVNFNLLLEWIDYCRKFHTQDCGRVDAHSLLSSIGSFNVIDCKSRRVVPWEGQEYATLSYVWGCDSNAPEFAWELPDEMPEIIEDAVELTRNLNIGHLWVDRYCINQTIKEEVMEQVAKMDIIYKESAITIIGATGEESDNNLPGVRRNRILRQPHATIGKYQIVSSMEDPIENIKMSKWWTRGWTYQEGLLARRRLIFTDEQVYFECRGMHSCESLKLDLSLLHVKNGQRFAYHFRNGLNLGLFSARLGHKPWEIVERIEEYSRRTLTNPADILDGFSGVISAFENSPQHLRHLFGVPIMPRAPKPTGYLVRSGEEAQTIFDSRVWTPTVGFIAGLAWQSTSRLERRLTVPAQPSWSWSGWTVNGETGGWTGPVEWAFKEDEWRMFQGDTDMKASVELQDGRIIPLDDFYEHYNILSTQIAGTLHISTWTTQVFLRNRGDHVSSVKVKSSTGKLRKWTQFYGSYWPPEIHSLQACIPVLALHLGRRFGLGIRPTQTYVMVIAEVMPEVYERVGVGSWEFPCLSDPRTGSETGSSLLVSREWKSFQLR